MSRVTSPCINVCQLDDARQSCVGCLRTLDEIVRWGNASDAERRQILDRLPARRAASKVGAGVTPGARHE